MKRLFACSVLLLMLVVPTTYAQSVDDVATAEATAAQAPADPTIERGRYLVDGLGMCGQCHTPRNARGELKQGEYLHGGPVPVVMPSGWANPWAYRAPRIAGLPQHTDEQFVTLMTTGINRDGRELMLPMPPYRMSEEDALAIAAYLRTLR